MVIRDHEAWTWTYASKNSAIKALRKASYAMSSRAGNGGVEDVHNTANENGEGYREARHRIH